MSTAEEVFAAMKEAVSAEDEGTALQRKFKGTALFLVDEKKYSLDLSSSDSCSVNEGDTFDGNADLEKSWGKWYERKYNHSKVRHVHSVKN